VNKTQRRLGFGVLAAALVTSTLFSGSAAASRADRPIGVRTTIDVVAEGLDVPRGVIFDRQNLRVLVAEAGIGGPSLQQGGICGLANGGARYCYGETGAIFEYTEHGTPHRIVSGLPSIANYDAATGLTRRSVLGLHDLSIDNGQIKGVFGLSGRQLPFRDTELVGGGAPGAIALGQAAVIGADGTVTPYGDLAAYEEVNNPHNERGNIIDSDPYGLSTGPYGTVVADAAGNDILLIKPDGSIQVLAVLADRDLPQFNDYIEPVPTAVVKGPDGAFYWGELTGFPYYKGQAKVWRLVPGQAPSIVAEGFTNIADITFDDRGRLIVLEMAKEGLFAGAPGHNGDTVTGRLVRVEHNGTQTELASAGLENPGGVAYVGSLAGYSLFYVTNRTAGVGGEGQLLRLVVRG